MTKPNYHRQITVADMAPHVHSFALGENKVDKITQWLINWIKSSLDNGLIAQYDLLPTKGELAYHIGVSQGTMQSVFRNLEDAGLVESKQRIGTYIKTDTDNKKIIKLTSKRETVTEKIKEFLIENEYTIGDKIPSTRKLAKNLNVSIATVRTSLLFLLSQNILKKKDSGFIIEKITFKAENIETKTLVEKVAERIRKYIKKNLSVGDKIPTNDKLAAEFNVSTKTIHDAIKLLIKEGLLYARRGQYGTIVIEDNSVETESYSYEKIEQKIKKYIIENCKIGDKLPTIRDFSEMYQVSGKTIKRALDDMMSDGYVNFTRGRFGGTFVTDIPEDINEAYRWLAINTDYISGLEN